MVYERLQGTPCDTVLLDDNHHFQMRAQENRYEDKINSAQYEAKTPLI